MKIRNPLYSYPTKVVLSNFEDAKNELNDMACEADQKLIYAEIPAMFFYNKDFGTALCTRCGSQFPTQKGFRNGQEIKCPHCKVKGTLRNCNLFKHGITYVKAVYAKYMTRGKNGTLCSCFAKFWQRVRLDENKLPTLERWHVLLTALVIRKNDVRVRMSSYERASMALTNRDSFDATNYYYYPSWYAGRVDLTVRKATIKGTSFEKYFDCMPDDIRTPDNIVCMMPQIEKLYKVGLTNLGNEWLKKVLTAVRSDHRWTKIDSIPDDAPLGKMLGVTKPVLDFMIKNNVNELEIFRLIEQHNLPLKTVWNVFGKEKPSIYTDASRRFREFVAFAEKHHLDVKKALRVFEHDTCYDVVGIYADYIEFLQEVGEYPDDKRYLYPQRSKLLALHDEMAKKKQEADIRRKVAENEQTDAKIRKFAETLAKFAFTDDKYLIRPLAGIADLEMESALMHHCVKTYAGQVAKKECAIFSLRDVEAPDSPIATIEVRKTDEKYVISQMRGKHNATLSDEIRSWINSWLINSLNTPKKRKKRATIVAA